MPQLSASLLFETHTHPMSREGKDRSSAMLLSAGPSSRCWDEGDPGCNWPSLVTSSLLQFACRTSSVCHTWNLSSSHGHWHHGRTRKPRHCVHSAQRSLRWRSPKTTDSSCWWMDAASSWPTRHCHTASRAICSGASPSETSTSCTDPWTVAGMAQANLM